MQMEMEQGGKLFFDLFVAMCNHMVRQHSRIPASCYVLVLEHPVVAEVN